MNKVALVTGGARGIGRAIAEALARENHDVAIADLQEGQPGGGAFFVRADVADAASRAALFDAVRKHFGRLHVLVNNAGVAPKVRADILEASEESYERVMRINLQGPYFLTQAAARWMIEQKQADDAFTGCIINISSISAEVASPSRGEYCLSKAGVAMATRLWAVRLAEFGIPVYEIRPGVIRTDMTAGVKEKYDKLIAEGLLLQPRWGTPEDVGKAAAMLARGDLAYATGQVLNVDGGLTVGRL
jgi:NAD(P)-dependent dehydrogenase (short-subunit alcohol dehydrogenase family)